MAVTPAGSEKHYKTNDARVYPRLKQRKTTIKQDGRWYKQRNRIVIVFGWLKNWRCVAIRYDRCPRSSFPLSPLRLLSYIGYGSASWPAYFNRDCFAVSGSKNMPIRASAKTSSPAHKAIKAQTECPLFVSLTTFLAFAANDRFPP